MNFGIHSSHLSTIYMFIKEISKLIISYRFTNEDHN